MESISKYYDSWRVGVHKEVDQWFLMKDPVLILGIVLVYLIFVLKIGPDFMKHRQPMELKKSIIFYNFVQIPFSAFLVYKMLISGVITWSYLFGENPNCSKDGKIKEANIPFLEATWWYFFAKVTELVDTVFFVLRKKSNQVTFLHVYHHSSMAFFTWCYVKFPPSDFAAPISVINSGVHVVMYTYYMVSALGPAYQKYLWWKKYMTVMQLAQFVTVLLYLVVKISTDCGITRGTLYLFFMNTALFFYLFFDFYMTAYKKKKPETLKENGKQPTVQNIIPEINMKDEAYSKLSNDITMNGKSILRNRQ